jgi:hypothetical protein
MPAAPMSPNAGTLLNSPGAEQYIITANHCLGLQDNLDTVYWAVLFNYEVPCQPADYMPEYQLMQVSGASRRSTSGSSFSGHSTG